MNIIAALTKREVELISSFVALLNEEQDALKRRDPSSLQDLAAAKLPLVDQLNEMESQRRFALGIVDDRNTREAMSRWLAENPDQQSTAASWKKLLTLAAEAKQLHELNAGLVSMHLQNTTEALVVLNRQSAQNTLYGSDGQAAQSSGSRIVDSA
jgi:flagella synthesis protein FlgN